MKIIQNITEVTNRPKAITIGNFDGVHKGHQSLIKTASNIAIEKIGRAHV